MPIDLVTDDTILPYFAPDIKKDPAGEVLGRGTDGHHRRYQRHDLPGCLGQQWDGHAQNLRV